MRKERIKYVGGEEDVFTGWRKLLCYTQRAGVCKGVKRGYNRRLRKNARRTIRNEQE